MVAWTSAAGLALGALWVSFLRLVHVARALRFDCAELAEALGQRSGRGELGGLAVALAREGGSWETGLLEELAHSRTSEEAIAVANEHIRDLARELDWGGTIPSAAARIGFLGPMSIVFFVVAGGRAPIHEILALFAWAAVGALGPLWVRRTARELVSARRRAADLFVARCIRAARPTPDDPRPQGPANGTRVDPSQIDV